MTSNAYKSAIELAGSGKKFPVMQMVRQDPGMAATIAKLVPSQHPTQYDNAGNREVTQPNLYNFRNTAEQTAQNVNDAETVMQLLPDMELAQQILVSSVGSPKDMMSLELTYTPPEGLMASDVSSALIERYRQHFEQVHKIKPLIPKMLRDMLFATGSYAIAVIPENSVDEVINGQVRLSMESLADHLYPDGTVKTVGLLGPVQTEQPTETRRAVGVSMESFTDYRYDTNKDVGQVRFESSLKSPLHTSDVFLTVTDNPTVLKVPQINAKIREQRIMQAIGSSALESIGFGQQSLTKMNDRELTGLLYRNKTYGYQPVATVKTQEQLSRRMIGNPMVLHIPSEAVIPVHVPGSPKHQIGFFVLLDVDGHPVVRQEITDNYQQMGQRMSTSGNFPSAMLTKVKSQMQGFDIGNKDHLDFSSRVYGEMVEQDLLARLRNGVYGQGVELAKREEIYRIMFSRALAKQHTQMLFIPVEFMTYFALRFSKDGIGESLLDEMKVLNSLRTMLLFANVMAGIKNSIGRTEVKLKFDEDDPNPEKTAEIAQAEIIRSRQNFLPLGVNSPAESVDFITRAGFEFTYEGHPGMPDVSIDFGEKNTNYTRPDTDLEDNLRKRAIMKTGIPPETVDAAYQPELATSVVTNNILLSKRVMQIQDEFHPQLATHMRIHAMNSEQLMTDMKEILRQNFAKIRFSREDHATARNGAVPSADTKVHAPVIEEKRKTPQINDDQKEFLIQQTLIEFLMNIEVSLPRPNSSTLENQVTALETYIKALDMGLEAWLSETFFTTDTAGDIAEKIQPLKETAKSYFIRQWMSENGMLSELAQLTTTGEDGKPLMDVFKIQGEHIEQLSKTFGAFFKDIMPRINSTNAEFKKVEDKNTTQGGGASSGGGDGNSGGGGDDMFGGGDQGGEGGGGDGGLGDMPDFGGTDDTSTGGTGEEPAAGGEGGGNEGANSGSEGNDNSTSENTSKPDNNAEGSNDSNDGGGEGNNDANNEEQSLNAGTDDEDEKDKDKDEKDKDDKSKSDKASPSL
ncbi:hypothetical protein [Paraburkholderia sp. BCC1886]|uniref:hypothetical protein n=1 Tax=Paraburkholderia sp. BCC1886 TaxID=2562670 RepID=UPI001182B763|nr:hypothetical protein [Paraburkholderia sp. BCC1886]